MLFIFGLSGGFLVVPFRNNIKYNLFLAPFAGFFVIALAMAVLSGILFFPFVPSMLFVMVISSCITLGCLYFSTPINYRLQVKLLFVALVVCAVVVLISNFVTLSSGHPGFLFQDGSDQAGYIQLADWLIMHSGRMPALSIHLPNQAWPWHVFQYEHRFGCYYLLAAITAIYGKTGMFSYHFACSVVMIAVYLAVSAVFSRSVYSFFLLLIGLIISGWYDFAFQGLFGKLVGYPAILLILGLFFSTHKTISPIQFGIITIFGIAVATLYNGIAVAMVLFVILGLFVIFKVGYNIYNFVTSVKIRSEIVCNTILLVLLLYIALAAACVLSRPIILAASPILNRTWFVVLPIMYGIGSIAYGPALLSKMLLFYFFILNCVILLIFLFLSFRGKNIITVAIFLGVISSTLLLLTLHSPCYCWLAAQFTGMVYPLLLCGMVWCVDDMVMKSSITFERPIICLSIFLLFLNMSIHLPRFIFAVTRYNKVDNLQRFIKPQMDKLVEIIGDNKVIINTRNFFLTLPTLIYFAPKKINMQWTPYSWHLILAYMSDWPAPKIESDVRFWLQELGDKLPADTCKVRYKTIQYQLVECQK
jgi:hypothetical protein